VLQKKEVERDEKGRGRDGKGQEFTPKWAARIRQCCCVVFTGTASSCRFTVTLFITVSLFCFLL